MSKPHGETPRVPFFTELGISRSSTVYRLIAKERIELEKILTVSHVLTLAKTKAKLKLED